MFESIDRENGIYNPATIINTDGDEVYSDDN